MTRIVHPDFDPEATDSDRYSYQWYDWNRSRLFDHLSEGSWDVVIHFNDLGPQDFGYSNHHRFKDWVNIGRIWDPPVSLNKGWSEWPWHLGYDLLLLPTQYHYDTTGLNSNEPAMVLPPAGVETLSNIDELDDLDSRPYDFGFINPIHHKGVELVAKLVGRFPTKRFLVKAGNYRSQAQLDKLSNWHDNVEVAGWYDNIDDYYRSCKAILYPSLQEGFGMVSYEALANGCLTFANAHPVMKSACPIGPVYIDAYPDSTKRTTSSIDLVAIRRNSIITWRSLPSSGSMRSRRFLTIPRGSSNSDRRVLKPYRISSSTSNLAIRSFTITSSMPWPRKVYEGASTTFI